MAALEAKTSSLNEDNQLLREKEDEIETKGKSKSKPRVPLYADCENSVNTYLLWEWTSQAIVTAMVPLIKTPVPTLDLLNYLASVVNRLTWSSNINSNYI